MELRNYTPFMPLVFSSQDVDDAPFDVVVLKGTYEIVNGHPLKLAKEPKPLTVADEYYGDPTGSSLKRESDLAPFKPRTDIHFTDPVAFAPGGKPSPRWQVKVQVGPVEKTLQVTGPRQWVRRTFSGWRLTEPEPVAEVPLRYENAFGGAWQHEQESGVCQENPLGRGFVNQKYLDTRQPVPAPQVEAPAEPITELGETYRPQGLGPLARAWQPRRGLAGTFDDDWLRTRWPALPRNFRFDHYNSSHPDLIAPKYLVGDEPVRLEGLSPDGTQTFRLPGHVVLLILRLTDGQFQAAGMPLDTVEIDAGRRECSLVWRAKLPVSPPIQTVAAGLLPGEEE
jgi:hypothetical protein